MSDSFPVDEMTLHLLRSSCEINPETGRTHLHDFLDMGTHVKSEELVEEGDGETLATAPVFLVEYVEGFAPWAPTSVIIALVDEIERLRLLQGPERSSGGPPR